MCTPGLSRRQDPQRQYLGAPPAPRHPTTPTRRTAWTMTSLSLWAWPSKGGLIVLDNATAPDLSFLDFHTTDPSRPLDPAKPPMYLTTPPTRHQDQRAEDMFAHKLLSLGAKYYESEARYRFLQELAADDPRAIQEMEDGIQAFPSYRERRWIKVAWPSREDKVWILDGEGEGYGGAGRKMVPDDVARVLLARDMDERFKVIRDLGGRCFESLAELDSEACLGS